MEETFWGIADLLKIVHFKKKDIQMRLDYKGGSVRGETETSS